VWREEGGAPKLLHADHFSKYQGRPVNFADDFLKPFIVKYINAMKEAEEHSLFFIEGLPNCVKEESHPSWTKNDPENVINAFHWYDGFSLFTKSFRSWFTVDPDNIRLILGRKNVSAYFKKCLAQGIGWTKKKMGNMPALLGEFGLAFDLNNRKGFKKGDYSIHEQALSMYYDAADANMLHSTIWNYSAGNTNKYGDSWNNEDLSIFSEKSERAAAGWKRPYPMATAGEPLFFNWNKKRKKFVFCFNADSGIKAPTVIYLPEYIFASKLKIEIVTPMGKSLRWEQNMEEQKLFVYNDDYNGEVLIKILG
jgi:hypothetical protein